MAHKLIKDKVVVDWTTGDPEEDRITLLAAYRDFIKEIKIKLFSDMTDSDTLKSIAESFFKWQIDTEDQIDEVPRIWIKRPE